MDKRTYERGGLFLHEEEGEKSLPNSIAALLKIVGLLFVFLLSSSMLITFSITVLHLTLWPMADGIVDKAVRFRWVYATLICLSIPTSFFLFLYWGRKYAKTVFAIWLPFLKWRFEKDKEAVIAGMAPHLKKNEKIVAHVHCEELFKECPMWISFFYLALFHFFVFVFAFAGGFWAAVEIFNAAIIMPILYFLFVALLWFSSLTNALDRLSQFFIQVLLTALTLGIAKHLWKIEQLRMLTIFFIVSQLLLTVWRFLKFRPTEFLVLTNRRLLHAKTTISLSPRPCYLPIFPKEINGVIEWSNSQFGQHWQMQSKNGPINCYPMFVSMDSLTTLARKNGLKIKAKKVELSDPHRVNKLTIFSVLMWVLLLNMIMTPPLHYRISFVGLSANSPGFVKTHALHVLAKHHPTAIGLRVRLAQLHFDMDEREKALVLLKEAAQMIVYLPKSLRDKSDTCQRAQDIFVKLIGQSAKRKTGPSEQK